MAATQRFCCTNHRVYASRARRADTADRVREWNRKHGRQTAADKPKPQPSGSTTKPDDPPIDWASLPGTVAQKMEAMRRQIRRELEAEFQPRLAAAVEAQIGAVSKQVQEMYDAVQRFHAAERNGIFSRGDYDLIRSCLHPDSRASASDQKLAKAFRTFNEAKIRLIPPPRPTDVPSSLEDLLKRPKPAGRNRP
jgi:ADP-ribose pyrophosphatase YjhB (NUDIX family)